MSNFTLRIATLNFQQGACITKGFWQYPLFFWRYLLPSSRAAKLVNQMIQEEKINLVLCTEIKNPKQLTLLQLQSGLSHSIFLRAGKRGEGLGILSRFPILEYRRHKLPGGIFSRILVEAVLNVDGKRVTVFLTHLALRPAARQAQSDTIARIIGRTTGPMILAGDFNEKRNSLGISQIRYLPFVDECSRQHTFPAWKPKRSLQRLFTREMNVNQIWTRTTPPFADHLPLLGEITIS